MLALMNDTQLGNLKDRAMI